MALKVNQKIENRYVLIGQMPGGGMGEIWLANDLNLGVEVIIKVVRPDKHNKKFLNSFKKESQIQRQLQHEGIPQIRDFFDFEETYFSIMEKIDGKTLKKILEENQTTALDLNQVLDWADQLLDILEYIHDKGVFHRDIKPSNIMLVSERNRIKLIDFGIAKGNIDKDGTVSNTNTIVALSDRYAPIEQILKGNMIAETIASVSTFHRGKVEQIRLLKSNAEDDIFSLGATLYEILTGEQATPANERATPIWNNQPDPLKPIKTSHIPNEIAQIIMKSLALERGERFSSASEMRGDFIRARNLLKEKEITAQIENERIQLQEIHQKEINLISEKYQQRIDELTNERDSIQKFVKQIEEEIPELRKQIDELSNQKDGFELELQNAKNRLFELSNLADSQKSKIEILNAEKAGLTYKIQSLEEIIASEKKNTFEQISDTFNNHEAIEDLTPKVSDKKSTLPISTAIKEENSINYDLANVKSFSATEVALLQKQHASLVTSYEQTQQRYKQIQQKSKNGWKIGWEEKILWIVTFTSFGLSLFGYISYSLAAIPVLLLGIFLPLFSILINEIISDRRKAKLRKEMKWDEIEYSYQDEMHIWAEKALRFLSIGLVFLIIELYDGDVIFLFFMVFLLLGMILFLWLIGFAKYFDEKKKKDNEKEEKSFRETINDIRNEPRQFLLGNLSSFILLGVIISFFLIGINLKNNESNGLPNQSNISNIANKQSTNSLENKTSNTNSVQSSNTTSNSLENKSQNQLVNNTNVENQNENKISKPLFDPVVIEVPKGNANNQNNINGNNQKENNNPCELLVSQDSISILSNGGNLGVLVGFSVDGDTSKITAKSSSPNDVSINFEPGIGRQSNRAFFVIKSISSQKGVFYVTFTSPCGKKEVSVKTR